MNNFPTENLKSIRIISATLSQPIAIACYTQEDEELVAGLESIIKQTNTPALMWCPGAKIRGYYSALIKPLLADLINSNRYFTIFLEAWRLKWKFS